MQFVNIDFAPNYNEFGFGEKFNSFAVHCFNYIPIKATLCIMRKLEQINISTHNKTEMQFLALFFLQKINLTFFEIIYFMKCVKFITCTCTCHMLFHK